jgi:hypothetical protein
MGLPWRAERGDLDDVSRHEAGGGQADRRQGRVVRASRALRLSR